MADIIAYGLPAQSGILDRVRDGLGSYRLYRRTVGELRGLTDRELGDIGVSRNSIRETARASVNGA